MNRIFCAKCGHPLYKRIYSNGNRLNWGCSGTKRYGKSFCEGINIPDVVLRKAWHFDGNMYIDEKPSVKGTKEFTYLKESSWKRRHKKKVPEAIPENTEEAYPYRKKIILRTLRKQTGPPCKSESHKVIWICNGAKRKGVAILQGDKDTRLRYQGMGRNQKRYLYSEKDDKNGKKRYSYTSKKPTA